MKLRQFRFILMFTAAVALAMPVASQACHKRTCGGYSTGVVFNQTDGMYYPVPGTRGRTVYRVVDYKYVPVATYRKGCYKHMVNVRCQQTPGWWWGYTWMSPGMECYYVR